MSSAEMPLIFSDRPRIEEVAHKVYRLDLCVPQVLGPTNSYVIKADTGRSLIVDTGCDIPQTKALYNEALRTLGISWDTVDVFITHFHWDHCAGLVQIWQPGMTIYSGLDDYLKRTGPIMASLHMPPIEQAVNARHGIAFDYDPVYWKPMTNNGRGNFPLTVVSEGDELCVGDYRFSVLEALGHEEHSRCLYDADAGLFVAGDQVLYDQYPSVFLETQRDQLAEFLESMKRLSGLNAHIVLCGHGSEGDCLAERCEQIISHYERQIAAFRQLCKSGQHDPGELAYLSTQQPRRKPWEQRPVFGRWALLGQTMAYVRYLVNKGELADEYELTLLGH